MRAEKQWDGDRIRSNGGTVAPDPAQPVEWEG
jgi:hypothetical protein